MNQNKTSNDIIKLHEISLKAILEAHKDSLSSIAPSISPTTLTRATTITKVAATTKVATTKVATTKVKTTTSSLQSRRAVSLPPISLPSLLLSSQPSPSSPLLSSPPQLLSSPSLISSVTDVSMNTSNAVSQLQLQSSKAISQSPIPPPLIPPSSKSLSKAQVLGCYYCGDHSHWVIYCPEIPENYRGCCFKCWENGHTIKSCKSTKRPPPWK
jgi:hypothetical protein